MAHPLWPHLKDQHRQIKPMLANWLLHDTASQDQQAVADPGPTKR